jgi:protein phosphatase
MTDRVHIPPILPPDLVEGCRVVAMSDVGRQREENQDFMGYVSRGKQQLLIVADGMGGHSGGFEASRIAVDVLGNDFGKASPDDDPGQVLLHGVTRANAAVRAAAVNNPNLQGMGSTITAALVSDGKAWLAHVGDSRIYLVRDQKTLLLTLDHSRIFRMIEAGMITPEQAENHPMGHILERSIGSSDSIDVEINPDPISLRKGDVLILCSDGLWSLVTEDELAKLFSEPDLKEAVEKAIGMALQRGADDNTTVGVLRMEEGPKGGPKVLDAREAMYARAQAQLDARAEIVSRQQQARSDMAGQVPGRSQTPNVDPDANGQPLKPWLKIGVGLGVLLFLAAAIYFTVDALTSDDSKSSDDDDGDPADRESDEEKKENKDSQDDEPNEDVDSKTGTPVEGGATPDSEDLGLNGAMEDDRNAPTTGGGLPRGVGGPNTSSEKEPPTKKKKGAGPKKKGASPKKKEKEKEKEKEAEEWNDINQTHQDNVKQSQVEPTIQSDSQEDVIQTIEEDPSSSPDESEHQQGTFLGGTGENDPEEETDPEEDANQSGSSDE